MEGIIFTTKDKMESDDACRFIIMICSIDLPMAARPDKRLFLIGDEEEYKVGGGLISEPRVLMVRAMAATKEFEARDLKEDKEDVERELEEAERKHHEEVEKHTKLEN
ncbi:hypothetical protein Tco_0885726 [Tanacetum coccineum]